MKNGYANCGQTSVFIQGYDMAWKLNLSRVPCWGGQFKRLTGAVKSPMYKGIEGGVLTRTELSKVLLDVETQVNRRPLSYVDDDILELPTLTPSAFLFQKTSYKKKPGESKDRT